MVKTPLVENSFVNSIATGINNFFYFRVKACAEAEVLLLEKPTDKDSVKYIVVLGANENMVSRLVKRTDDRGDDVLMEVDTPFILNCDAFLPFWVVFNNDQKFEVGVGNKIYEGVLISFTDVDSSPVHGLTISTSKLSGNGDWEFSQNAGTCHKH